MSEREYLGICPEGHRSYLRLDLLGPVEKVRGRCSTCDRPARLSLVPPVSSRRFESMSLSARLTAAVRQADTTVHANDLSGWAEEGPIHFVIGEGENAEVCKAERRVGNMLVNVTRGVAGWKPRPHAAGEEATVVLENDVDLVQEWMTKVYGKPQQVDPWLGEPGPYEGTSLLDIQRQMQGGHAVLPIPGTRTWRNTWGRDWGYDIPSTGSTLKFMPPGSFCPDVVGLEDFGEADYLRGKVVRAFFWLMRLWPHPTSKTRRRNSRANR